MRSAVAELWREANAIGRQIDRWIERHDSQRSYTVAAGLDQARLLRLRTWELRYHVRIPEILDLIVPSLRHQMSRPPRPGSLGVSVRALVGHAAEDMLKDAILRRYPAGEQQGIWRTREQDKQVALEYKEECDGLGQQRKPVAGPMAFETVAQFAQQYQVQLGRRLADHRKAASEVWRKRKHYRGNPWL